jgi:uncharacterized membrane protein
MEPDSHWRLPIKHCEGLPVTHAYHTPAELCWYLYKALRLALLSWGRGTRSNLPAATLARSMVRPLAVKIRTTSATGATNLRTVPAG